MRRAAARGLALLALSLATACGGRDWLGANVQRLSHAASGDLLVSRPAQQLALSLADLPPGFQVAEELKPALDTAKAAQDPWGRLSAYAVTYVPAAGPAGTSPGWGDVVSSVNAYVGRAQATDAFASWRSAVPTQYRLVDAPPKLGDETAVYVRDVDAAQRGPRPTCLVGVHVRNVIASVSVSASEGGDVPVETATRLARLTVQRIQAVAGH
jgi:hypothetical protein